MSRVEVPHSAIRPPATTATALDAASIGDLRLLLVFRAADTIDAHRAAIQRWADRNSLRIAEAVGDRAVRVHGAAANIEAAFGVRFCSIGDSAPFRGYEGSVSFEAGERPWASDVLAVLGLHAAPLKRGPIRRRPAAASPEQPIPVSFLPTQVAQFYQFPTQSIGAGQTAAIVNIGGGYDFLIVQEYWIEVLGLTVLPTVKEVSIDGQTNSPSGTSDDDENYLDIEMLGGIANGATILSIFAPNTGTAIYESIVAAYELGASVVSISYGATETLEPPMDVHALQALLHAHPDLSVLAAAGDNGSTNGMDTGLQYVLFPASAPSLTAVGGTTITVQNNEIVREVVWNELANGNGATGGGVSAIFPVPPYQLEHGINPVSANPGHAHGRGVPDVAANADPLSGYTIAVDGGAEIVIGGTSASTPLWAALITRLNSALGRRLGFLNPVLYDRERTFRDITVGNNGAYAATVGYDLCTGLGTPHGVRLLQSLQPPRFCRTVRSECHRGADAKKTKTKVGASVLTYDANVGFQGDPANDPVPDTPECIGKAQAVVRRGGATTAVFYGTATTSTIAANPRRPDHIVAAWQNDAISNGGALEIGIAFTADGGRVWQRTVVPLQRCIGGLRSRAATVTLAWTVDGARVLLAAVLDDANGDCGCPQTAPSSRRGHLLVTSTSADGGATWSTPAVVWRSARTLSGSGPKSADAAAGVADLPSLTADASCPAKAYLVFDLVGAGKRTEAAAAASALAVSQDRGCTWSEPRVIYDPASDVCGNGVASDSQTAHNVLLSLARPRRDAAAAEDRGDELLNFFTRIYAAPESTSKAFRNDALPLRSTRADLALIRSSDGGEKWSKQAVVVATLQPAAQVIYTGGYTLDGDGEPTSGVGVEVVSGGYLGQFAASPRTGALYAVYQAFFDEPKKDCPAATIVAAALPAQPQIALVVSRDRGRTWSEAVRVNRTPRTAPNPQAFTPAVAVTRDGVVAVRYTDFRYDDRSDPENATLADTWLALYHETTSDDDDAVRFVGEVRLTGTSYVIQNGATTNDGVAVDGRYAGLAATAHRIYASYMHAFSGPFVPPTVVYQDPARTDVAVIEDRNRRTDPFVTVVRTERCSGDRDEKPRNDETSSA